MPTIQGIDSFQHRIIPTAVNATNGWYSAVGNAGTLPNHGGGQITFDTSIKRTDYHACSLKIAQDGVTVTGLRRAVATTMIVGSVYFRIDTAPTSTSTQIVFMAMSSGAQTIRMRTTGFIEAKCGTGTAQTNSVNYADGLWHRLDWKADTTGATATLDIQIDGSVFTQSSVALASANMTTVGVGSGNIEGAMTAYYNDLCWSVTVGDYPLGDHICLGSTINGTGTHNKGAGTWSDEGGATTDAELLNSVDDVWDGTTPELSQTGEDHVKKSAGVVATEYLEFLIEDASPATFNVWGAQLGALMAGLDSATADTQEARLVDGAGTTLATPGALIDATISATAYTAYRAYPTAAPSGGWASGFNDCRVRWGFTNDVSPNPVFNAAFVEYVGSWPVIPHITMPRSVN